MYVYDQYDQKIVDERVAQYRDQTDRFLAGKLSEAEFLPLRLQNGLYVQRLAPMLRIAVPYGLMNSTQLRKLAEISRDVRDLATVQAHQVRVFVAGQFVLAHAVSQVQLVYLPDGD